jgi:hypothetical protein
MNPQTQANATLQEKILAVITRRPNILRTQIADAVDVDTDDMNRELNALVQSRAVLLTKVDGPNGLKTDACKVDPTYLGWKSTKSVVASEITAPVKNTTEADAPLHPEASKGAGPVEHKTPLAVQVQKQPGSKKPMTKVDKAIDYLKVHGTATAAELLNAMGLPAGTYPLSYLKAALARGLVARKGDKWIYGPNAEAKKPPVIKTSIAEVPEAVPVDPIQSAGTGNQENYISSPAIDSSLHIGTLHIALWTHGALVISDGSNSINLPARQADLVRTFLKMTGEPA